MAALRAPSTQASPYGRILWRHPHSSLLRMKFIVLIAWCLFASFMSHASDFSDKLKTREYVLLMRHTLAPGIGDPPGYSLEDCKTQRNLNEEGQKQAVTIGHWLRKQGVQNAAVRSSTWCRCKDTAALLKFDGYKIEPSLGSFFDQMSNAKEATHQLQKFISANLRTKGNKALILVTHHVNILDFIGENIASGDMVLTQVDTQGKMVSYKLIPRPD